MRVLQIINRPLLCEGVTISKSIMCSRYLTTEIFQNLCDTENTAQSRKIPSVLCIKVVPLFNKNSICTSCQRMTFNEKRKSIGAVLQESGDKREVTEDDFRRLIPNAPDKMIILLLSPAKNIKRDPKGRGWPREVIPTCLQQ